MGSEPTGAVADDESARESSVGLVFTVAVEIKRRRGIIVDRWEARMTAVGIVLVAAIVIILALSAVFDLLRRILVTG